MSMLFGIIVRRSVKHCWRLGACAAVLQGLNGAHVRAQPKPLDWASRPYQYLIVDQDLRMVLDEFGRNNGIRMMLTPAVQGRVRGNMPNGTARSFLDGVTRTFGLDWYFDGVAVFVTANSESRTKLVELHGQSFNEVFTKIKSTDIYDERYQLRPGPSAKVISVFGPPRFVEAMTEAITAFAPTIVEVPLKPFVVTVIQGGGGPGERIVFPPLKRE